MCCDAVHCLGATCQAVLFSFLFFFFNDTATTEIYTLSLHDALPICPILFAEASLHFILPISRCGSAPLFILPISRCGSGPLFFARFSLRQRPCILYCPFLVAAAPRLSILPISRCGSAPLFLPNSHCGSAPAFYTDQFSVRDRKSVV